MLRRHARQLKFESLEERTLLAASPIFLKNGVLEIRGTKESDVITVRQTGNNQHYEVAINYLQTISFNPPISSISINGGAGDDLITVDDSVTIPTRIRGGKGNDTIKGGAGQDLIYGDAGNDTIFGSGMSDYLYGNTGEDIIHCGDGSNDAWGGKGDDIMHGGSGQNNLYGEAGNDTLYGAGNRDRCVGGAGNDLIYGGDGPDLLLGDAGNDLIYGGDGADLLFGDAGNDALFGDNDNDHIDGGKGIDDCHGGADDDQIKGGAGIDRLDGDGGDNLLDSDKGRDEIYNGLEVELDNELQGSLFAYGQRWAIRGYAKYEIENNNGTVQTTFTLQVSSAGYSAPHDVFIDGVLVGQVQTNQFGRGELQFSTHPTGSQLLFPSNFPRLKVGSKLEVPILSAKANFVRTYFV